MYAQKKLSARDANVLFTEEVTRKNVTGTAKVFKKDELKFKQKAVANCVWLLVVKIEGLGRIY